MVANGSVYPKTYRYGPVARIGCSLAAVMLFLLSGVAGVGSFSLLASWNDWRNLGLSLFLAVGCLTLIAIGFVALISGLRGKLVLYEDRLEYTGVSATRVVRRDEIAKIRAVAHHNSEMSLTLVLKSPRSRQVRIRDFGKRDDLLAQWFGAIPNADAEAHNARVHALATNPAFGHTPEERWRNVARHRRLLLIPSLAICVVFLWGVFFPLPYHVCIYVLIAVPIATLLIAALSGGRYSLGEQAGKIDFSSGFFLMPVLLWRVILDSHLVSVWLPLTWGAAIGLVFTLVGARINGRFRPFIALMAFLLATGYGYGAAVDINAFYSDGVGVAKPYPVTGKQFSSRNPFAGYRLKLATVNSHHEHETLSVRVRKEVYDATPVGGQVCLYLYTGPLRIRWYRAAPCPASSAV